MPLDPGTYPHFAQTHTFHASIAKPMNPDNLNGVDDNTQLMHLHEPSLLYNLRFRYGKDLIYTYTGYILIAVNPYKKLACYGEEVTCLSVTAGADSRTAVIGAGCCAPPRRC